MATIAPGKVVLLIMGILILIVALFIGLSLIFGVGNFATDSTCKFNAAMNSLSPNHWWVIVPNFACHVKSIHLDAKGAETKLKNILGSVEGCSCGDFYGPTIDYYPVRLFDNNFLNSTEIPVKENKTQIKIYVYNVSNLTQLVLSLDNPAEFNYTLYTQVLRGYWGVDKKCTSGGFSGTVLNIQDLISPLNCPIQDNQGVGIKLSLYNFTTGSIPLMANQLDLYNLSGVDIPIKKILLTFKRSNLLEDECLQDSEDEKTGKCTPEWEKKWVEKKLMELAIRCWKMGGQGRLFGDFDCYTGCVYYNSSVAGIIQQDDLHRALDENFQFDSVTEEYIPYNQSISLRNMTIERTESLENKKCYFMKYHHGDELRLPFLDPGTFLSGEPQFVRIIPEDEAQVIIGFGRTVADASKGL